MKRTFKKRTLAKCLYVGEMLRRNVREKSGLEQGMNEPWQQQLIELQKQLVELQTQLAFYEDEMQALDRTVIAQQQRLDQLEQSNGRLEKQLADMLTSLDTQAAPELPPHY
jgi:SlyX protein